MDWAKLISDNFALIVGILGSLLSVSVGAIVTHLVQASQQEKQRKWDLEDQDRQRKWTLHSQYRQWERAQLINISKQVSQATATITLLHWRLAAEQMRIERSLLPREDMAERLERLRQNWQEGLEQVREQFMRVQTAMMSDDAELIELYGKWGEALLPLVTAGDFHELRQTIAVFTAANTRFQHRIRELVQKTYESPITTTTNNPHSSV